ncbi:MAG: NAD(P)-dependent glycerol-3-phosphate dehydrogenase [Elusimicrobiales bacterium]|nr:NAD(P)-dependent glycerol-3-phosphate dehydrogenase [Elusimicrobiales bacterium]
MNYNISVIGAGTWGTTIANLLAIKNFKVKIWAKEHDIVKSINHKRENSIFLKGIKLSKNITAFNSIDETLNNANIIINAVPVQYIREVYSNIKEFNTNVIVLNLSKGIEVKTLKTPSQILKEIFKSDIYILSGPNFAIEIAQKKPAATTIAGEKPKIRKLLQLIFHTSYFRVYENDDIVGCEISGALKNVIAIAAGMCDALELGYNTKAALITRGLNEIRRIGKIFGAKDITFLGLAGIGDLVLTCNSMISRNYQVGYNIVKNGKIIDKLHIAEGIFTSKAVKIISEKFNIEAPISEQVYNVLYRHKSPQKVLKNLMLRRLKSEF